MLFANILNFCLKNNLIHKGQAIVVGLSGGPDSVFLLHFLNHYAFEYDLKLIAAHLDHEWRTNSQEDSNFCKNLAESLQVPFVEGKASELPVLLKNGSQEALGRNLRRYFLENVCKNYHADAIALGHHAQDQQETFFIRLIRGTSLSGLIGIKPRNGYYIRPLLEINKKDIVDYLHLHSLPYIIDPTNEHEVYLRNRIRLKILPIFEQVDKRFNENFLRTLHNLQETEQFLEHYTVEVFNSIAHFKDSIYYIQQDQLLSLPSVILYRIIMLWIIKQKVTLRASQALFEEIVRFLHNQKSNCHTFDNWKLCKKQGLIFFMA